MKRNKMYQMVLTSAFAAIILVLSLVPQIGYITILPGVSITLVHIVVLVGVFSLGLKGGVILGLFFGIGGTLAALMRGNTPFDQAFVYPWVSVIPRMLFAAAAYYFSVGFKKILKVKYGKVIVITLVSMISGLALFFGTNSIVKNATKDPYNKLVMQIAELKKNETENKEKIDQLNLELPVLDEKTNNDYKKITNITQPIVIVITVLVIGIYVFYTFKNKKYDISVPSVMILGTLAHTVLVLLSVYIFSPQAFTQTFGDSQSTISIIYGVAMANGLVEALAAVVIGTPIVYALEQVKEK
ncbi:conserved hypothetical protein [Alteracholeplasma palmae J233]|uniref:ECF transporter S component n=1 Tax=Alteracholeplasma palmae (strain ATCC 49389 / J233) TaxID=1318466 RepID=U4KKN9_ALTPJ|nr:ECF transporter S component [Alteracholeplasma palmae]CCV64339.1 conserved hypothetical protein [Alteracholeplasma palmae J233]